MNGAGKKFKTRKVFYAQKWFRWSVLIFIFILLTTYILIFSPVFRFNNLVIEGNQRVSLDQLRETSLSYLSSRTVKSLVGPIGIAAEQIKKHFPYIDSIRIFRRWPNTLVVSLTEKEPYYCLQSNLEPWLFDQDGNFLESIDSCPEATTKVLLSLIDKEQIGANLFIMFGDIKEKLAIFPSLTLKAIKINGAKVEIIMENPDEGGAEWSIYLDRSMETSGQLFRLGLFLQTREMADIARLRYVDVGGHQERVYYVEQNR